MNASGDAAPTRRDVSLLARVKALGEGGGVKSASFGNVIELGAKGLVLEASRDYQVGDALIISVVFPGVAQGSNRINALECVVRRVRDEKSMHYDVTIEKLDAIARQRLSKYLARSAPAGSA